MTVTVLVLVRRYHYLNIKIKKYKINEREVKENGVEYRRSSVFEKRKKRRNSKSRKLYKVWTRRRNGQIKRTFHRRDVSGI